MNNLTHAFFLAFRGKEMVLVRGTEESPDEWGIPFGVLGDGPTSEMVEMILKEKYFREITIETMRKITTMELGNIDDIDVNIDSMFIDALVYVCNITGIAKLGPVFFAKHNNTSGLNISERARIILTSEYVQSRLH